MNKLFLLDAYALIYRAYYANIKKPLVNSKGLNTSAMFGFVNSLEDVLKREKPAHIAVAFDPAGKTFRHEAFEQYKAQRQKTPEDIKIAIPYIKQIIDAYGIASFQVDGFEADDVIGTLAKKAAAEGFDVFMMTPDKDYAQLVDTHIFQYKPKFGTTGFDTLGINEIKQRYELENPLQMIDYLGLMGDASDNIPGCPGVGEKTAAALLKEFGSIENLLENTSQLKGALKERVENNREQIVFSKFLATIRTDVPVEFSAEKVKRQTPDLEKMTEIFTELEFRTLLARVVGAGGQFVSKTTAGADLQSVPKNLTHRLQIGVSGGGQQSLFDDEFTPVSSSQLASKTTQKELRNIQQETRNDGYSSLQNTEFQYFLIDTEKKIDDLIAQLAAQKEFCFDTETTSLNTFDAEIVGLSFAFEKHKAYFVPLPENQILAKEIINKFKQVFENENINKIGQNAKYDIMVLLNYDIEVKGKLFDTMIAHYLINPDLRHNMDYMAEIFLGYKTVHYNDLF